jgi:DtxR family Mn-dependent transcriptional regulator
MHRQELEDLRIEELCEEVWSLGEREERRRSRIVEGSKLGSAVAEQVLGHLVSTGMAEDRDGQVRLMGPGETLARAVVRRHRLAEVLLGQVLAVGEADAETTACEVEHILNPAVTDRICTYLGHPPVCPHGKSIPKGDCCLAFRRELQPLVQPLADLPIGSSGRIVFITPAMDRKLDRLVTLGIVPGGVVRLRQKRPAVVLEAGQTSVALDREIAMEIYVMPLESS